MIATGKSSSRSTHIAMVGGGLLTLLFAVLSWTAVSTKNATIDEPAQLLSGISEIRRGDFRMELASPPLWQCWAALGDSGLPIRQSFDGPLWKNPSFDPAGEIVWASQTLFSTPGNDGEQLVQHARAMMLLLGMVLAGLIGFWAYQLSGTFAAMVAMGCFCLDPNFIAHTPLIKGDVPFALAMLGLVWATWRLGQHITMLRLLVVGLLCGAAINAKFSGLLLGPMLAIMLTFRATMRSPWPGFGRIFGSPLTKMCCAAGCCFVTAFVCYGFTWGCYAFRFRPAPDSLSAINIPAVREQTILREVAAANLTHRPTAEDIAHWQPSYLVRVLDFANDHHLLPQAMIAGLMYQHACVLLWPAYLVGQLYGSGRWYYFPLAALFKVPVGIWLILALGAWGIFCRVSFRFRNRTASSHYEIAWTVCCLTIPVIVFGFAAVTAHLNIGFRNVLPIFPFFYIAGGIGVAKLARPWHRGLVCFTFVILAVETIFAWPNYIAFFNFPSGGERGGYRLLGDSNLDWGQDIKGLALWQKGHPGVPLFLFYYGTVDPHFYGLKYHPIQFSSDGVPFSDVPIGRGIVAISVTALQGIYLKANERPFIDQLSQAIPIETVGGSIYLFALP